MCARLNAAQPYAIALFRAAFGLLFTMQGVASLFGVLGGAEGTNGGTIPVGTWPGRYGAVIQLVAGALVMLGLGTRWAALVASGAMAFAHFDVHQKVALWPIQNGGEPSVCSASAFLLIFTGCGAFGLDRLFDGRTAGTLRRSRSAADPGKTLDA
ncbi:DoxX family protein [Streptomyces sasae]|uniref:DoxX family protein n=1 Tax=Streptomyces sasae TaxID=1266772 RepID=UPI00292F3123|nr:DoxX family protein [Streptomyces sasae]